MMPLEPVTLSFGAALLLGLSFGSGPCNIACLPYLGPVFMHSDQGIRGSWRTLLPFSLGRMTGYALLGAAAGWAGLFVEDWIARPWVRWVLGAATILVALSLLWRRRARDRACAAHATGAGGNVTVTLERQAPAAPALPGGLFLMGAGMALNPCAPLTTIIIAAATTASALAGMSLGVGFGLGAVVVPTLVFAFGVAHFSSQIREQLGDWRGGLELASIGLLVLLGIGTAGGWIVP